MKHLSSKYQSTLKKCIQICEKTFDSNQALSEVCSINLNRKCAALLGKAIKLTNSCIKICEVTIKESMLHIKKCEDKKCVQKCKTCIRACKSAIRVCQKSIEECKARTTKCITLSFKIMKNLSECAQACQACLNHAH